MTPSSVELTTCDTCATRDPLDEILAGLRLPQKQLPCRFFYDDVGSRLFDRICRLPEYYPTRTELGILRRCAGEIAELLGPECLLVEYGSGSSTKTRLLLDHLERPAAYVPIDISGDHLLRSARALADEYPNIDVLPLCADFNEPAALPEPPRSPARCAVFYPGSTIGNFDPEDAVAFLRRAADLAGADGALVIGVDLQKERGVLERAYNDAAGVTAEFNINILRHLNRTFDGDFDSRAFRHRAVYNQRLGRIEMHLVSLRDQAVSIGGETFDIAEDETLHTENSYKYTLPGFADLAAEAGWRQERVWTDEARWFSVQYLTVDA